MSKKTITISEDLYNELLQIKKEIKEDRQTYDGYTKAEIDEFCPQPTLEGAIQMIMYEKERYKSDAEDYANQHCMNCCTCEDCVEIRRDHAEAEAEWKDEQRYWESVEEY